jgi:hypothetical protein
MASPPIACSLSAEDYRERLAAISEVGSSSLIAVQEGHRETIMRFRHSSQAADRLRTIVAQEGECCTFLDLSLRDVDDELVLTLPAPEEARPIVDDLIRSFRAVERGTR